MNTLKRIAAFAVVSTALLAVGIGGWMLERWLNWKICYGRKVDRRIEQLEKRIEALERHTANAQISGGAANSALRRARESCRAEQGTHE